MHRSLELSAILLLGLTAAFDLEIVGRLFVTELMLAALLPILVLKKGKALTRGPQKILLMLGVVWLFGLGLADFYRDSSAQDYLRGWAKVGIFCANVAALFLLLDKRLERFLAFSAGLAGATILDFIFDPSEVALEYSWKFGYGYGVSLAALAVISSRIVTWTPRMRSLGAGVIGLANLLMGSRGAGLVYMLGSGLLLARGGRSGHVRSARSAFVLIVAVLLTGVATVALYGFAARSGLMGETERLKYEHQTGGGIPGLLVAGRYELVGTMKAIVDSPLIGHGSWARDRGSYSAYTAEVMESLGVVLPWMDADSEYISAHSFILGAWVEAGVFGIPFWLFVLVRSIGQLRTLLRGDIEIPPFVVVTVLGLLWSILFSPLGGIARLAAAVGVCVVLRSGSLLATGDDRR